MACHVQPRSGTTGTSGSDFEKLGLWLGLVFGLLVLGFILLMTLRSVRGSTVHVIVNRSGANGTDIVSDRLPYGLPVAY